MSILVASWSALALVAWVTLSAAAQSTGGVVAGKQLPLGDCEVATAGRLGKDPKIITQYNDGSSQKFTIIIPPSTGGVWFNVGGVRLTMCSMYGQPKLALSAAYLRNFPSRIELLYWYLPAIYPKSYITVELVTWRNVRGVRLAVCTMYGQPNLPMYAMYINYPSRVELMYVNQLPKYPQSYFIVEANEEIGPGLPDTPLNLMD